MSNDDNSDEDKTLFREAMRSVEPLKPSNKKRLKQARRVVGRKAPAIAQHQEHMFSTEAVEDCPTQLSFSRSGIQYSVLKKLRQGKFDIESVLDLHGMFIEQAREALIDFLGDCAVSNVHCAIIVHGKGYRSPGNKPVIKPLVNRWLRESPQVLAFTSAQPKDGGSGAVYVLFKKN